MTLSLKNWRNITTTLEEVVENFLNHCVEVYREPWQENNQEKVKEG